MANCEPIAIPVGRNRGPVVNFLIMTEPLQCPHNAPRHQYGKVGPCTVH